MSGRSLRDRLDHLPSFAPGPLTRVLWLAALGALGAGLVLWAAGGVRPSVYALYCFCVAAAAVALVLPRPYSVVSPLFMGLVGWLVDMLPLLILVGWTTVVLRWLWELWRERRLPRGGRWIWLPIGLLAWTAVGVLAVQRIDFKHFLLLLGIQFVASGAVLLVADGFAALEDKVKLVCGLGVFVTLLSTGVLLQWVGIDVEALQDDTAQETVETAYGLDAFPNSVGMIKYARSVNAGSLELRRRLEQAAARTPDLPSFEVFRPKFEAFENSLVVRFEGSARPAAATLQAAGVSLLFDNVGLAPANTVPRMRSFPRNALTYAGVCAALFPFMLWLSWSWTGRRRLIGRLGAASCLFGAAFSLARGSWIAILIALLYLLVDGLVARRYKIEALALYAAAALLITGVFLVKYGVDPATGRAGGGSSIATRSDLYTDTLDAVTGKYLLVGYGTEQPRLESGGTRAGEGERYVPRAGTHSTYLNYLFRTGLPGMFAIAALYVLAILHARAAARSWTGAARTFATLAAAGLVAAAAHAAILSLFVEPTYTLTVSLLLGLAFAGASDLPASIVPWKTRRTA